MWFCYVVSFNIVIITMMLGVHSSLFLLRVKHSDFDKVFRTKREDIDIAEYIINIIKIAFLIFFPLINTIIAIMFCVFWEDFRDAICNNLEKTYIERRLKYYE